MKKQPFPQRHIILVYELKNFKFSLTLNSKWPLSFRLSPESQQKGEPRYPHEVWKNDEKNPRFPDQSVLRKHFENKVFDCTFAIKRKIDCSIAHNDCFLSHSSKQGLNSIEKTTHLTSSDRILVAWLYAVFTRFFCLPYNVGALLRFVTQLFFCDEPKTQRNILPIIRYYFNSFLKNSLKLKNFYFSCTYTSIRVSEKERKSKTLPQN